MKNLRIVRQFVTVAIIIHNQALHIAERNRMRYQCQCIEESLVCFFIPLNIKGNHPGILPVTARPSVDLADLMAESLILMEEDAPYSLSFERALAERQLSCRPVFRLQSALAACHMVQQGPFLSVLPFYTVQSAVKMGQVIILNVPEWRHQQVIQAVLHRSRVLTPQLEGFFEELEQFFAHCLAE